MTKEGKYIEDCSNALIKKYLDAGGSVKHLAPFDAICWFFEGVYDREGQTGCEQFLANWKYKSHPVRMRGYS